MGRFKATISQLVLFGFWLSFQSMNAYDLPPRPEPAVYVNDLARIFTESQRNELENILIRYYDSTSTQIIVATVPSLEGDDASNYAISLGNAWGVGQKSKNNGVVFLIAPNERKMFIATGYGTEEKLTDVFLTRIRENGILPEFKKGDYYSGVKLGVQLMINRLSGKFQREKTVENSEELSMSNIFVFVIILLIFLWIISKISKSINYSETYSGRGHRRDHWDSGGFFGGGFGGFGGGSFGGGSSGGGFSGGSFGGGSFGGGGSGGSW
jgi:uncharacterized protein